MTAKTEELISPASKKSRSKMMNRRHHHHHTPTKTHQSQVHEELSGSKNFNKASNISNKTWSMSSLMADLPPSPPSSFDGGDSPPLPCNSPTRPSTHTVFYSPTRFQIMNNSKRFPNNVNISSSFESARNLGFLEDIDEGNGLDNSVATHDYESSIGLNDRNNPVLYSVPPTVSEEGYGYLHKRGTASAKCGEFGDAIPVINETRSEHRLSHRPKSYQEFLDETRTMKQKAEIDAMKKASYTYLLRKLTEKEEAIDDWESNRKKKAEIQLAKLEKKLEQKRDEAVRKVHKKLEEATLEAKQRKAKARRSALKEMAKHCTHLN